MNKALAILMALSVTIVAQADLIVTTMGTTLYDFESYGGTTSPVNWNVNTALWSGLDSGSGTSGGGRAYTNGGPNRAFGFLGSGSLTAASAQLVVSNNTGYTITELTLKFDVLQYRLVNAGRSSTITLDDVNTLGFVETVFAAGTAGTTGLLQPPTSIGTYNQTVTGLNIASGSAVILGWNYDRGGGAGSAQGMGIDNVSITVVPEPATMALLGMGLLGLAFRRRR